MEARNPPSSPSSSFSSSSFSLLSQNFRLSLPLCWSQTCGIGGVGGFLVFILFQVLLHFLCSINACLSSVTIHVPSCTYGLKNASFSPPLFPLFLAGHIKPWKPNLASFGSQVGFQLVSSFFPSLVWSTIVG